MPEGTLHAVLKQEEITTSEFLNKIHYYIGFAELCEEHLSRLMCLLSSAANYCLAYIIALSLIHFYWDLCFG
jgi:hypothetical protein